MNLSVNKRVINFLLKLKREFREWFFLIVTYLPGSFGSHIRRLLLFSEVHSVYISVGSRFVCPKNIALSPGICFGLSNYLNAEGGFISIGSDTSLNSGVHLNASVGGKILIGRNCLIGPNVLFRTASHRYHDKNTLIRDQGHDIGDITLEEDVWIGAGAILLGGISIGKGAVIGAGAVVTKDIPAFSVAVGIPALVIRQRS